MNNTTIIISENDKNNTASKMSKNTTQEITKERDKSNKYKCKSSTKSNTSFNKKLSRKYRQNKTNINLNNCFYTNHYTTKNDKHLHIENLKKQNTPIISKFNNKLNPGGINNNEFSTANPRNVKFCLNCGNYGHTKGQCSEPNIANGVIAVRYNTNRKQYEYLIVMRKHSHGYCDIIRGKYPDNYSHIRRLFEETTNDERKYIINNSFYENWLYLWGENNSIINKFKNTTTNEKKFNYFKEKYLDKLIDEVSSNWIEPEWGFPKGQRDGYEKNNETAFREFSEESGYSQDKCACVSNLLPLQEIFIGSNNKKYKQNYYLAFMDYGEIKDDTIMYQENEIGNAAWVSIQELLNNFRYYDTAKIKIAIIVNNILKTCGFVCI